MHSDYQSAGAVSGSRVRISPNRPIYSPIVSGVALLETEQERFAILEKQADG